MVACWFSPVFLFVFFFLISCENVTNLHNFLGVRVCVISFLFYPLAGGSGGVLVSRVFLFGLAITDFDD